MTNLKPIKDLNFGFSDAENYKRRENKQLQNDIFLKNIYFYDLFKPNIYFLIGDKGTGKTAYSTYLSNNDIHETKSIIKFIRETDYQKFIFLKKEKHLQLSDYTNIWKVILLLLLSSSIEVNEVDSSIFSKTKKIKSITDAINEYYNNAFNPEIISTFTLIENSKSAAEIIYKFFKLSGEESSNITFNDHKFQSDLAYIQRKFEETLNDLKLNKNKILFIDGIDIRPDGIPYNEYLDCIKGLTNAIWSLNNDFFPSIKDSKGRLKIVMLIRPDIFNSISIQNLTNKIHDNSILLNWQTTYPAYRTSQIFYLSDKLLSFQQSIKKDKDCWDLYFPWVLSPTDSSPSEHNDAFIEFLRYSYCRPRDIVRALQILQKIMVSKNKGEYTQFEYKEFKSNEFQNEFSDYLMGTIKDQIQFYYSNKDYEMFLNFFDFLKGYYQFNYDDYITAYNKFTELILEKHDNIPEFVETQEKFIQFLYDNNIICYSDETESQTFYRWCYRERSSSNIFPKVKLNSKYRIHYGLFKALNVGKQKLINQ